MRTLDSAFTAAQVVNATPYIHLEISTLDLSSRILNIEHREEPYRESAYIVLDNHDRALDPGKTLAGVSTDFRGCGFTIGYGYNTATGNQYLGDGTNPGMPTMWVKSQYVTSVEGKVVCVLESEGMWDKLREILVTFVGSPPDYDYTYNPMVGGTQTIKEIIALVLAEASMTLHATVPDDGIIDTVKPWFNLNLASFPSLASIIYNNGGTGILQQTKCYLRRMSAMVFRIIFPQSTDAVDETYYSDADPQFKEYTEKRNLTLPNHIIVLWGADDDDNWIDEPYESNLADPGEAIDTDSTGVYSTIKRIIPAPHIATKDKATLRAEAVLARYKAETLAGRLVLPFHDCSVELFDRIAVYDNRI